MPEEKGDSSPQSNSSRDTKSESTEKDGADLSESGLRALLLELNCAKKPNWSVPVGPDGALPVLVRACTALARKGRR